MRALSLAMIGVSMVRACCAQGQEPAPATLKFDVASVKVDTSVSQDTSLNLTPGDGLDVVNNSTRMLITFAYDIRDDQLSGGPAWAGTERYDIRAKTSPAETVPPSKGLYDAGAIGRVRLRLQALLAERFQLVLHRETREMPVYALVVGKNGPGPKLQLWKEGNEAGPQVIGRGTSLTCKKVTLQKFAEVLAESLGRTVLDRTGLSREYNIKLEFVPEQRGASADLRGPTFLEAVQEQLGLKLETQKGPVTVLVIDHAEKPSAN
jgi:bla regulator protein blaR1